MNGEGKLDLFFDNGFSEDNRNILTLLNIIISSFSIFFSCLIILIYWYFKELRNFNFELVVWLSISTILYNVTAYIPYEPEKRNVSCAIQACMIILFQSACWIWSCVIGYSTFISVIKKDHMERLRKKYRIFFVILVYSLAITFSSM
jgi:hypothetical protein